MQPIPKMSIRRRGCSGDQSSTLGQRWTSWTARGGWLQSSSVSHR